MKIDLNCDMGESFGRYTLGTDEALMPHITSANIACGFHASDPLVMDYTVRLAREQGVPPYVIFHDSTLREMAAKRPLTEGALRTVNGVGERKLARFGRAFIHVISEYV